MESQNIEIIDDATNEIKMFNLTDVLYNFQKLKELIEHV